MSTEPDDPADTPASRPHKSRMAVAAVVTAVLLAGGGSAWWAAANSGGDGTKATPAPLRMDGPGLSADVTGGGPAGTTGGGASYQLTGTLPKGPDDAAVYRASGPVPQSAVRHLASLLGVSGAVASDHDTWRVGGTDGGPALLVGKSAPGTWSYALNGPPPVAADPDGATSSSGTPLDTRPDAVGGGSAGTGSAPVSEAAAKAAAKPVLDGLGLSGASVDASQTVGEVRTVSADPAVGGLPTHGWGTSLQVGSDGKVRLGYGRLADLAKGATYPVVSAATALKELNATPMMHPDYGVESCRVPESGSGSSSAQSPSTGATAGATDPADPTDKRLPHSLPCLPNNGHPTQVRGAVFGLALQYVSGVQTLVPAWLFQTAQASESRTSVVAQTAVDPAYIRSGPVGTDPSTPRVNPGGPNIRPTPASPPAVNNTHRVPVDSYTVSGDTLTLAFVGGLCNTYAGSASESAGQVKVAVTATPKRVGVMCPAIAKSFTVPVTLAQPLGSRTVVDLSSGQPLRGR